MQRLLMAASIILCGATTLIAQKPGAVRLTLMPGSELTFTGTSTLHDFTCRTKDIQAFLEADSSYRTKDLTTTEHPLLGASIVIPIKSLTCGGKLEGNMRKALLADKHPNVTYVLSSYHAIADSTSVNHFAARTVGALTLAGTTDSVAMRVDTDRDTAGTIVVQGTYQMQMTDFGIKPPTFMFGTLRTGNSIKLRFTLKATAETVRAARTAL